MGKFVQKKKGGMGGLSGKAGWPLLSPEEKARRHKLRRYGVHETSLGSTYSDEELMFLKAIDRWKSDHEGRTPDCREVLEIALSLGYRKTEVSDAAGQQPVCSGSLQSGSVDDRRGAVAPQCEQAPPRPAGE